MTYFLPTHQVVADFLPTFAEVCDRKFAICRPTVWSEFLRVWYTYDKMDFKKFSSEAGAFFNRAVQVLTNLIRNS